MKRDPNAVKKTREYFLSRAGRPTTVRQAAKALGVPTSRVYKRVNELTKQGVIVRISRGVYSSPLQGAGDEQISDRALLEHLLKEREHLDADIERVRRTMELKKQRTER